MLVPHLPVSAYQADVRARRTSLPLGAADAVPLGGGSPQDPTDEHAGWVVVATALHRMADLAPAQRPAIAAGAARAWGAAGIRFDPGLVAALAAVDRPHGAPAVEPSASAAQALTAIRQVVEAMENGGAFHLAFTTLAAAERAFAHAGPGPVGWTRAQRGRVARQLGELEAALDLYASAGELGQEAGDVALVGRAAASRGIVANMRGNYPEARAACLDALAVAGHVPSVAALAHHTLMVGAQVAGDVNAALEHGWRAFEGAAGDATHRADALINLAEIVRKAGHPAAAIQGFRAGLRLTLLARLRLPALGGAARAAAALGDRAQLAEFTRLLAAEGPASGQPYEYALAFVELAEAHAAVGQMGRAQRYAAEAAAIGVARGFHEVAYRAGVMTAAEPAMPAAARADDTTGGASALTPFSRTVIRRVTELREETEFAVLVG